MKPVLIKAIAAAKTKVPDETKNSDNVTQGEYRWLLKYVRIYYDYYIAFFKIDTDHD